MPQLSEVLEAPLGWLGWIAAERSSLQQGNPDRDWALLGIVTLDLSSCLSNFVASANGSV